MVILYKMTRIVINSENNINDTRVHFIIGGKNDDSK